MNQPSNQSFQFWGHPHCSHCLVSKGLFFYGLPVLPRVCWVEPLSYRMTKVPCLEVATALVEEDAMVFPALIATHFSFPGAYSYPVSMSPLMFP